MHYRRYIVDHRLDLEGLEIIRLYYKRHGIQIKIIRSDDFTSFKSRKVRAYYAKYGIERQSSTPYQHWQNSVERDIHIIGCFFVRVGEYTLSACISSYE